jgi:hypothetical protein
MGILTTFEGKPDNVEYVARFLIGGFVVSAFALLGDLLRPKSFAGLFGAAPSVALATLASPSSRMAHPMLRRRAGRWSSVRSR